MSQVSIFSDISIKDFLRGSSNWLRFFIIVKAALLADRGPNPGSFDRSLIKVSISGPTDDFIVL